MKNMAIESKFVKFFIFVKENQIFSDMLNRM